MPFKSEKQKRFFGMCADGKIKDGCPPRNVIDEFFEADRRMKGKKGKGKGKGKGC
jgi:hypothetical protein